MIERFGNQACEDQGATWNIDSEIVRRDDGELRDVGYPSSIQLAGGTLVTVYYIHGPDGTRHIATPRWQLA